MKTIRYITICGSFIGAIGLLVLLLTALSPAKAAPEVPIADTTRLNAATNDRWRILADMQTGRGDPGVVTLNNKIHVVSGYFSPGFGYSSSQEVYDPQTGIWQYLWGFPVPRSDMVVVILGDKIYAIGGWNIDLYDPANDKWSIGIPLSTARSEFGAVILNGLIYAIGGTDNINDVEINNPATHEWNNGTPLPETRYSMALAERQGKIYAIGGTDIANSGNGKDTTIIYDPILSVWSASNPMPTARSACDATVISDTIYVLGGAGEPGAGFANEAYADFDIIPSKTQIVTDYPDPSQAFQPFVISYLVTSSLDVPIGVVTVTVDQNVVICSDQLVGGVGSCEFILDTPGIYTVTAAYGGDDFHSSSSDSESHMVIKAATTTTITGTSPDPSLQGQLFLVTFGVTSTYGSPAGVVTVTVSNSQQSCSDDIVGGVGSCEITLDTPGTYTITVSYAGDISFAASSDSTEHLVVDMFRLYLPIILREKL